MRCENVCYFSACKRFSRVPFMLTVFPVCLFSFLAFTNLLKLFAAVSTLMFTLIILDWKSFITSLSTFCMEQQRNGNSFLLREKGLWIWLEFLPTLVANSWRKTLTNYPHEEPRKPCSTFPLCRAERKRISWGCQATPLSILYNYL